MTTIAEALIEVRADTSRVDSDVRRSTTGLSRSGSSVGKKLGLAMGGAAAAAAFGGGKLIASAVQLEAQYSKTMNVLQATTKSSGAEMAQLDTLAKKMGADTVFSANDASTAMLELARGGMSAATIQGGALEGTMTLAAAGELEMGEAANVAVKAMGQFNLKGREMGSVAAAIAGGANASSASVGDMAAALAQGGLAADSVGFSIQETTGILAAFSNAGLEGSDAGTSLKTMLDRLQPSTDPAQRAMQELGLYTEKAGSSFVKANGEFKSAAEVSELLARATEDLSSAESKRLITQAFGSDAQRAATILAKNGAEGIERLTKATSDQGAAQRMASANMKGTAGALEQLKGAGETALLTLGQGLAPTVQRLANYLADEAVPAAQRFADWMNETGGDKLAAFAGNALDVASAIGKIVGAIAGLPSSAKMGALGAGLAGVAAVKMGSGQGVAGAVGSAIGMTKPMPVFVTNPGFAGVPGKGGAPVIAGSTGAKGGSKVSGIAKGGGAMVAAAVAFAFGDDAADAYMDGFERNSKWHTQMGRQFESGLGEMVHTAADGVGQATKEFDKLPKTIRTRFGLLGVPESKSAAQDLAKTYNLTPKEKRTMFRYLGYSEAMGATQRLIKQYNLTPGTKTTNFQLSGVDGAMSALSGFTARLAAIRDKTVTVTTVFTESGRRFKEFAEGTSSAPGGLAWVGERGPELMSVPRGSQVIPAPRSRRIAEGGGSGGGGRQVITGKLELVNGYGYISGIAADEYEDAEAFAGSVGRMRK